MSTTKLRFTYQYSGRLTGRCEERVVEFPRAWLPVSKQTDEAISEHRELSGRIVRMGPEKESILSAAGDGGDLEKLALKIAPIEARLSVYSARQSVLAKAVRKSLVQDLRAAHAEAEKAAAIALKEKQDAVDVHKIAMAEALGKGKAKEAISLGFISCEQRRAVTALNGARERATAISSLLFACDRKHFLEKAAVGTSELPFDSNCDALLRVLANAAE